MATGGYDQSLDNRVTCSICLEPYKGRQPKLLPCFHTFCLPCLTQLANRNDSQPVSGAGDGNGAAAPVTLTCPTCRTPVPLPPAGVSGLHNNVYVDDSCGHDPRPLLCDLCEEGQSAKLNCSTCKAYFCTRCRRCHDRLCKTGQVTEIEVQQTMGDQTMQAAPLEVVDMLQAAMQRLLGEGQQSKQSATTPKETGAREKIWSPQASLESDVTDAKSLAAAFSQLMQKHVETDKLVTTLHSLVMSQQNQNGLLCRDLASLHEKNGRQEKELSAAKKEFDALQREVVSLKDKNAIVCQDNQLLRNDVTKLQGEVDKHQGELSQLKTQIQGDISALKNSQAQLQGEVASLKTPQSVLQADQGKLQSSLTSLEKDKTRLQDDVKKATADQGKLQNDVTKLHGEVIKHQAELSQLKTQTGQTQGQGEITAVKNSQAQLQGEVASLKTQQSVLQADVKKVKADQGGMQSNFDRTRNKLQDDLKKVSTQVAFHARLIKVVKPKKNEVIVCSDVVTNVGGGYNHVTGIFTAPDSGVYCFVANATANSSEATKSCCASIVIDDDIVAHWFAFGQGNCTAHVSLSVKAGQKVWLRSFDDNSQFHAGGLTSFTGFLVQAYL